MIQYGTIAVAVMTLVLLRRSPARRTRHEAPPAAAPEPRRALAGAGASKELVSAWVHFIRDEVADAANVINNRLGVIHALAARFDRTGLSVEQLRDLEQITTEASRAAKLTSGLHHHLTAAAPDTMPATFVALRGRTARQGVILLVDDDDASRDVMTRLLTRLGHRVIPARDGLDAFSVLQLYPVDCIVSDVRMPGLGGRGLYEQVEERLPHLARQFVFVTGDYTRPETREFLERAGCPIVAKPYDIDALLAAVGEVLERAGVLSPQGGPDAQ